MLFRSGDCSPTFISNADHIQIRVCMTADRLRDAAPGSFSRLRHSHQGVPSIHRSESPSLRPFAPPELPGFNATMDALTPVRSAGQRPTARSNGSLRLPFRAFRPFRPQTPGVAPFVTVRLQLRGIPSPSHEGVPLRDKSSLGFA